MPPSSPNRGRWTGFAFLAALAPIALAVVAGCSGRSPFHVPPDDVIAKPWANVGETTPSLDGDTMAVAGLSEVLAGNQPAPAPGRPLNLLVMSGGGKYGAFTAGVLAGWTASGTRPTFDVATGISSGAVTAVLAFLGPKYDPQLTRYFTTLERGDLFKWQPIRGLCRGDGVMSAEPLERILAHEVNDEFMADLRAAHAEGRRLYIATGNVLTNRVAVWDLGAIACSGRPEAPLMIRKILLASCSPPGVVAPVEFETVVNGVRYSELHADAGNIYQAFVRSPGPIPAGSTFWALSAGKIHRSPLREKPRVFGLIGGAVSNSLYALFRADLVKLYALCAVTRSQFRMMALPQDFPAVASSFAFDPEELKRMYWVGYQMAANGNQWRTTPPDTLPGEANPPRTGFEFITPP